jgi:hypothetical protein
VESQTGGQQLHTTRAIAKPKGMKKKKRHKRNEKKRGKMNVNKKIPFERLVLVYTV